MNRLGQRIGVMLFWLTWPGLWLILRRSKRTRVAIHCQGEILVTKTWLGSGKWSLPGGGIHKNEQPIDAAIREVAEEIGVTLSKDQLSLTAERIYASSGLGFRYYQFSVSLKTKPDIRKRSTEIADVAWIKPRILNRTNTNYDALVATRA